MAASERSRSVFPWSTPTPPCLAPLAFSVACAPGAVHRRPMDDRRHGAGAPNGQKGHVRANHRHGPFLSLAMGPALQASAPGSPRPGPLPRCGERSRAALGRPPCPSRRRRGQAGGERRDRGGGHCGRRGSAWCTARCKVMASACRRMACGRPAAAPAVAWRPATSPPAAGGTCPCASPRSTLAVHGRGFPIGCQPGASRGRTTTTGRSDHADPPARPDRVRATGGRRP